MQRESTFFLCTLVLLNKIILIQSEGLEDKTFGVFEHHKTISKEFL